MAAWWIKIRGLSGESVQRNSVTSNHLRQRAVHRRGRIVDHFGKNRPVLYKNSATARRRFIVAASGWRAAVDGLVERPRCQRAVVDCPSGGNPESLGIIHKFTMLSRGPQEIV